MKTFYCSQSWEMRNLLVTKMRKELRSYIRGLIRVEIGDDDLIIITVNNTEYNFNFVRSYEINDEDFSYKENLSKTIIDEFEKSYQRAVERAFFIPYDERMEKERKNDLYNRI